MKELEILIKLPSDYFMNKNELDLLSTFSGTFRDSFQERLVTGAVEKALKEIKLPEITISKEEVKEKMLKILAERALENL